MTTCQYRLCDNPIQPNPNNTKRYCSGACQIIDPHLAAIRAIASSYTLAKIRFPGDLWPEIIATLQRNGLPTADLPPVDGLPVVVNREAFVAVLNWREGA